jgi:hypothetical protein
MAAIVFAGDHDDPYLMPKIVGICEIKEPLMIDILS